MVCVILLFLATLGSATTISITKMQLYYPITGAGADPSTMPVGINGTDLGIIYQMPNKQMGFLFGDTFGAVGWNSNDMGIADLAVGDWTKQLRLSKWIVNPNGLAKELVPGLHQDNIEMTIIPNGAISFTQDSSIYMQYMSVKHWGDAGIWYINNASFAVSKDNGQNWQKMDHSFTFAANSKFAQTSIATDSKYIYLLGTSAGRVGPIYLARVPTSGNGNNLLIQSQYQYLNSTPSNPNHPTWSSSESAAVPLFNTQAGETSIAYNSFVQQWIVMYFDNAKYQIEARVATNVWGPWTDAAVVATGVRYPELYGGYMHSNFMLAAATPKEILQKQLEGTATVSSTVYFTMSMFQQYEAFWCSMVLSVTQ